ncbi:helicase POLQ-like isoform X1 [Panulirus ornatus]|uniref:helicase POLQ-like isoform X1 n=1 Tax=Panulirus ornatus TaxID=150431 RepID=UPI003A841730
MLFQATLLFLSPLEVCYSTMAQQEDHGLTSLIFSSLGLGIAESPQKLKDLTTFSLLAVQASALEVDIETKVVEIVESLRRRGLVCIKHETDSQNAAHCLPRKNEGKKLTQSAEDCSRNVSVYTSLASMSDNSVYHLCKPVTSDDQLTVSRLGQAAIKGSVDLNLASCLYKDLCVARENLAVNSHLHLLYLVVPYDIVSSIKIIPDVYYSAYMALGEEEIKVAKLLGITEGTIVRLTMGHKSKNVTQSVLHRFYMALLLHHVWMGMGVWQASELFQVHRGFIQQILTGSAAFASCVYHFCQELEELWAFRDLLATFTRQLSGFCSAELLPLMDLPAVKKGRAQRLYSSGYRTLQDIANAEPKDLVKCVEHLSYCNAVRMISSAKVRKNCITYVQCY